MTDGQSRGTCILIGAFIQTPPKVSDCCLEQVGWLWLITVCSPLPCGAKAGNEVRGASEVTPLMLGLHAWGQCHAPWECHFCPKALPHSHGMFSFLFDKSDWKIVNSDYEITYENEVVSKKINFKDSDNLKELIKIMIYIRSSLLKMCLNRK